MVTARKHVSKIGTDEFQLKRQYRFCQIVGSQEMERPNVDYMVVNRMNVLKYNS